MDGPVSYTHLDVYKRQSEADKAKALGYVNDLNQLFVDIVRNSGGNNAKRHLLVEIYNTNLEYAYDPLFKMPNDPANRLALTVHYYTPANFAILGGGEVVDWGVGLSLIHICMYLACG